MYNCPSVKSKSQISWRKTFIKHIMVKAHLDSVRKELKQNCKMPTENLATYV